jgi:hypothetical protein
MNGTFTLLWSRILDSSVWMESKETRLVWITLLAMKDRAGVVVASPIGLAHRANVELEECVRALDKLMSPDPYSTSGEFEGRRIEKLNMGWRVLNHEKYRQSDKRIEWTVRKREDRERNKTTVTLKIPVGELADHVKALRLSGKTAEADKIEKALKKASGDFGGL